jgi:trimeric autotransporter adhesin
VQQFAGTALTGTCSSDERLKKDIKPLDDQQVLERLALVKPSSFEWRAEEYPQFHYGEGRQLGVIAQQVEQSVPELVQTGADGFKKVKYADLNIYILQGIRELKVANDNLVSETSALRAQLKAANDNQARLEERMEWLERKWSRPDMTGTK